MKWNKIFYHEETKRRKITQKFFAILFFFFLFVVGTPSCVQSKNILHRIAEQEGPPYFARIAARIKTNFKTEEAYMQLDTLLLREQGDMFWMYGCAGLYYSCKNELPQEYKEKVRKAWKLCTPYRGDTDNHFLMYYSSLYLMAQEWSDLPESEWFLGKSSRQITKESREYLEYWIDETVRYGMSEFDSPRYMYYYITPLVLLAEYVADAKFKRKCAMMLELVLTDYAHDYYFGNYAGAHSRVGFDQALDSRKTETASYGQFYFEDSVSLVMPDIVFAAMSKFLCPEIIKKIATEKQFPFFSQEKQQGRRKIGRHTRRRRVAKTMWMTKDYALGSSEGGLYSPIQQQSWTLTLNTNKSPNVITGLHPSVSADEFGDYFPEDPAWQLERIERIKKGYSSEDKVVGGSKYERIYQSKNIIVGEYSNINESVKYPHIDLILPGWGIKRSESDSAHYHLLVYQFDSVFVAIRVTVLFNASGNADTTRLRLQPVKGKCSYEIEVYSAEDLRTGYIPKKEFAITQNTKKEYDDKQRFNSKYISSGDEKNVITLKWNDNERILDFNANTITEKK
jgi:hypothetical protein